MLIHAMQLYDIECCLYVMSPSRCCRRGGPQKTSLGNPAVSVRSAESPLLVGATDLELWIRKHILQIDR